MAMKNSNKRQLITSMMSLGLTVVMLTGTTLAWFTDSAQTTLNQMQSGELDISLSNGNNLEWSKDSLLYPSSKHVSKSFTVKNEGNLDAKFMMNILKQQMDENGNFTYLSEILKEVEFGIYEKDYVNDDGSLKEDANNLIGKEIRIEAGKESKTYVVVAKMNDNAGNAYQGQTLKGVQLDVRATQDIEGAQYSKDDTTLITNYKSALANGTLEIGQDITVEANEIDTNRKTLFNLDYGQTIDGKGHNIVANYDEVQGTTSIINATGGTIKNINLYGSKRSILGNIAEGKTLTIENVKIYDSTYAMNPGGKGSIVVKKSELNGWTSYENTLSKVSFEEVKFGRSSSGYAYLRPYTTTTLTNCTFEEGFTLDSSALADNKTITLVGCKIGETPITDANIKELLDSKLTQKLGQIYVDGKPLESTQN